MLTQLQGSEQVPCVTLCSKAVHSARGLSSVALQSQA